MSTETLKRRLVVLQKTQGARNFDNWTDADLERASDLFSRAAEGQTLTPEELEQKSIYADRMPPASIEFTMLSEEELRQEIQRLRTARFSVTGLRAFRMKSQES